MNRKKDNSRYRRAIKVVVFGVVQGVGFRPFIYRTAKKFNLRGCVKNIGFGVEIHLESEDNSSLQDFIKALKDENPPLSQIEDIKITSAPFQNFKDFSIKKTKKGESFVFISPDISICENCYHEMMTPRDRRFRYPFINCTDCGPRYTIVKALPYDRRQTTMESFRMCQDCAREYYDPLDRRYHAQPIACSLCGPEITLEKAQTGKRIKGGIRKASSLIRKGEIVAVKGLGGFHLVCDALNHEAVSRLRKIKTKRTKPLALMARNTETVEKYAFLSPEESDLLLSPRRPILLLRKKKDIKGIAPHLNEIGFMLPYTPLHYLLLKNLELIVATSSNKKDAPIMKDEEEGIKELCDYILSHDRPIHMRADDSVIKIAKSRPLFLRRARGFVPYPQTVPKELESPHNILALGGELKATLSVYKNGHVITSQFLGDLDEYQNYSYFEETLDHLKRLFEVKPYFVISDLHPNFHTTRYAQKSGIPHLQVQHHFAHVLACLLEHKVPLGKKVLGIAFDGYGYGEDGLAWGGEFLLADYSSYRRLAHFKYVPLPGGDLAAKQPWRMAVSYLHDIFGRSIPEVKALQKISEKKVKGVMSMIEKKINSPLTSSCGRLFDSISFITGLSPLKVEYEAEAPMRLEAVVDPEVKESYGFSFLEKTNPVQISFEMTIRAILNDLKQKKPHSHISSKFHNTLARLIVRVSEIARKHHAIDTVVFTGGVFLNKRLLEATSELLEEKKFRVLRPINYSPNDESISIGQIAYALANIKK
ncbi:MAG: carbamoyltransferase HypF [Candidatus Aminicenantaceae bacterium]